MSVHAHRMPLPTRGSERSGPVVTALTADRAATADTEQAVPPVVHRALRETGGPLDDRTRIAMDVRFGHDFSRVRVHTGPLAEESARAVGARAYTVGSHVVFARGEFDAGSPRGRRLLAHELVHVLQQPLTAGSPSRIGDVVDHLEREADDLSRSAAGTRRPGPMPVPTGAALLQRVPADPTAAAEYPTVEQQRRIQEVVNPLQTHAEETHAAVPPVTDIPGLRMELTACANHVIDQHLPAAQARQASTVQLGVPAVEGLADVAQREVGRFYARYLTAAVHSPAETAARTGFTLKRHLHLMPADLPVSVDDLAKSLLRNRMLDHCADILRDHNVVVGQGRRDEALFQSIKDDVFNARPDDVRTLARFNPGFQTGGEVYLQAHLPELSGRTAEESAVGGRWRILGTTIHEMLHAVAHEKFRDAVRPLEERDIAVEGFAEFFTRPVFDALVTASASDAALRAAIEGVAKPPTPELAGTRTGYQRYVDAVRQINDEILGGNTENLKVAYFMGRVEFVGLGGWNAAEAERRAAARRPAHQLGAAILLVPGATETQGGFQLRYTTVALGRAGNVQLRLGGQLGYLNPGSRLSLGGTATLQYSWPNVYVGAGATLGPSTATGRPLRESIRLDLLPEVEAGVRLGAWRVGAGMIMLVPVVGGPVDERTVRWGARIGVSVDF